MAVETLDVRGNLSTTAQSERGPSPGVWATCPWQGLREGSVSGTTFDDDFTSFGITVQTTEGAWSAERGYSQFSSTGGTIANDTTEKGGAIAIGSDGDNEGCSIRTTSIPFKIIRNGSLGRFWFETRILTSTIADTKHNIFVGLMADVALTATVPITAAGALADTGLCGFFRPETARSTAGTGGAIMNTVYKASGITAVTVQNDAVALVAATYIKLGITFEPDVDAFGSTVGDGSGKYLLSFYVNGIRCSTQKQIPTGAGTDFPNNINLGLCFAVLNATGTTPGTSSIDWWRAAQLA